MQPASHVRRAMGLALSSVLRFVRWSAWLVLSLLIGLQVYIASRNSLEVPPFILRAFEQRLQESGAKISFEKASFDPSGRILIENAKFSVNSFPEPIMTARSIYGTIDPWSLLQGRFEPKALKVTGVKLFIPAMLSATGKAEEAIKDLDAGLTLRSNEASIDYLTCRLGTVSVSAHGYLHTGNLKQSGTGGLPLTTFVSENYAALSREIASAIAQLAALDSPVVNAQLEPSDTRGAIVRVTLDAAGLSLESPVQLQLGPIRAFTRFPLLGDQPVISPVDLRVQSATGPWGLSAQALHARVHGTLIPSRLHFDPNELELTAASVESPELLATDVSTHLKFDHAMHLNGELSGDIAGTHLLVEGATDLRQRSATLTVESRLTHAFLTGVGSTLQKNLTSFVDPVDPILLSGTADFAPGWAFSTFKGRIDSRAVQVGGVLLSSAHGLVDIGPGHFNADDIYLGIGDDWAAGTYRQDTKSQDYRFLLHGQLRPLHISGWFPQWWRDVFVNFDFPGPIPNASVDVQGRWSDGYRSNVYVFMEADKPVIRGVALDKARTRLFVRPFWMDIFEAYAATGSEVARARVRREVGPDDPWPLKSIDFELRSTAGLDKPVTMFGKPVQEVLAPFGFDKPPTIVANGHIEGSGSPNGLHHTIHMDVTSDGVFRLFGFPIDRAKAAVDLKDDAISVTGIDALFAGGAVSGSTSLTGPAKGQTLTFDGKLANANLAQMVQTVVGYHASLNNKPAPAMGNFLKDKANVRVDLSAHATGNLADIHTFTGGGSALVQGPELANVQMLGLLSEVLRMTSLRFTTARADFSIHGPQISFPNVNVTGANSAIEAQGSYWMDRHALDFRAKIYPFRESSSPLKLVANLITKPILSAIEMRLSGDIEKPTWSPALSLFNFLGSGDPSKPAAQPPANP